MERQRLEQIIMEELEEVAILDEGFMDRLGALKSKFGRKPSPPSPPIESGPYKGRPKGSLSHKERFRLGCYDKSIEQGYDDVMARKGCGMGPATEEPPEEQPRTPRGEEEDDGRERDGEGGGDGSGFAIPVFKKFTGDEQKAGAPVRSLSSQLHKLFPNVDKKIITQILKDIAGQLKTNGVSIQEAKYIIAEEVYEALSLLNEGRKSRGDVTSAEVSADEVGDILQATDAILDAIDSKEQLLKFAQAVMKGKHPDGQTKLNQGGAKKLATYYEKAGGKQKIEDKLKSLGTEDTKSKVLDALKSRLKELDLDTNEGMAAASKPGNEQAYLGAYMFYKAMVKLQKALKANPNSSAEDLIGLVKKELGGGSPYSPKRTGPVQEALLIERVEVFLEHAAGLYLIKMLESVTVLGEQQYSHQTTPEIVKWLEEKIKFFKIRGLADGKRAVAAARVARGAKGAGGRFGDLGGKDITRPQEGETPEDVVKRVAAAVKAGKATRADLEKAREQAKAAGAETSRRSGQSGAVNTLQVVGSRLKQGGIDIKSPEGQKMQNRIQKVIRRFLRKNLQRIGKDVDLIAEQKIEERLVEMITNYIIQNKLYEKKAR